MSNNSFTRLAMPREICVEEMRAELGSYIHERWRPQTAFHTGKVVQTQASGWRAIPLRSIGGRLDRTDPGGPGIEGFLDTAALANMPRFREFLSAIPGELRSARLLALEPGAEVPEHRDDCIGFRFGQVRLHLPVTTNPQATITIDGSCAWWDCGLWFGDFSRPHSVANHGDTTRIHLVIDCLVSQQMLALFPPEFIAEIPASNILINAKTVSIPKPAWQSLRTRLPSPMQADLLAEIPESPQLGEQVQFVYSADNLTLIGPAGPISCLDPISYSEWRLRGWTDERTFFFTDSSVILRVRHGTRTREVQLPARR